MLAHQTGMMYDLTNWLIRRQNLDMDRHPSRDEIRQLRERLRTQAREFREEIRQRQRALREQRHQYRRMGTRGQPEESRAAILHAAAQEFAEHGIAGARTDQIAQEARVNKALLYYYFKDKETLYGAVLDDAFSGLKNAMFRVLDSDFPPREKVLAYAGAYFDYIASHQLYPRLMQREMMRAREGQSQYIDKAVKSYIQPTFARLSDVIRKGIAAGEFRAVDPVHFVSSMVAITLFYFSSAPMMQKIVGYNPLTPQRIAERRAALLDFIAAALFPPKPNTQQGARS
jgi:TetR/AcrR family transcriptional regulator